MKIGINATGLHLTGGPTVYTKNLIYGLSKINIKEEIIVYATKKFQIFFPEKIISPVIPRIIREEVCLPEIYKRDKLDIIFEPKGYVSPDANIKKIVVLHDIIPFEDPASESLPARIYWRYRIPKAVKYADVIITDSKWSRDEIVGRFPETLNEIAVVYIGTDPKIKHNTKILSEISDKYSIKEGYILFVGTIKLRKNIPVLIRAFEILKKEGLTKKLILAGRFEYGSKKILKFAKVSQYKNDIIFTGAVPDNIRDALYQNASLFVYPSLKEGFGLPVLEAMKFGLPTITTEIGPMIEIGGDAVLYFDGVNVNDLSQKMKKLLTDKALRKRIIHIGRKRVKEMFSIQTFAEKIYQKFV